MGLGYWPVVATGVVILIAIATSNRALRGEMSELRGEMSELCRDLGGRIDGLSERVTEATEQLGRVEGMLEGIWFKLRQSNGKWRGGED